MKAVPFSDILSEVCQLIGLDRSTLNDKSFASIRDFTSRRIGTIWDREEWPDINRFIKTFTGNPVSAAAFVNPPVLQTESLLDLTTQDLLPLFQQFEENTIGLKLTLDSNFPRVYLADFFEDAYRLGTITQTEVAFENPFYYSYNGELVSLSDKKYTFTYTAATDSNGAYISDITINLPYESSITFPTYQGPNGNLTTTVLFDKNPQRLVQMPTGSLQGLAAWQRDPRLTTRVVPVDFTVEDIDDIPATTKTVDVTYLRFLQNGEKHIQYRLDAPRLTGNQFENATAYAVGSQVYYDTLQLSSAYEPTNAGRGTKANFWNSVVASSSVAPADPPNQYWEVVAIPYRFKDFLVNGVSSDFLKSEGRTDEAVVFDQIAEMAVQQQIDVLIRQQGQVQKMNMAYTY
jgi:hypothetical protein